MLIATVREAPGRYVGHERSDECAAPGSPRHQIVSDQRPGTSDHPRSPTPDPRLSEATLVRLWAGQRFPASALVTRQGMPLRALHPGRRGRGAGPDFRDALIATPTGALLRGDVELHVRASDFRAHGHQRDRRYDGVVLHLVFDDDDGEDTRLASGREVPVVALAPWVNRRAHELQAWLTGPDLWREPCHDAVVRLGHGELLRTMEELGDRRFRERETVLGTGLAEHGPAETLYRALLSGLGYGGDRGLLEALTKRLPWREVAAVPDVELIEALLLGVAGLLPSQQGTQPGGPASGRPANHPARRLAGLARLLARHRRAFTEGIPPAELLAGRTSTLIASWTVAGPRSTAALIGRGRAIELLVNAVLPWAAACAEQRGDRETATLARACFARLPRPGRYGALAFLEADFRVEGRSLPLDARRQQGLLALYKTECTQGGCGRCPLS